jgi:hypothetical protein
MINYDTPEAIDITDKASNELLASELKMLDSTNKILRRSNALLFSTLELVEKHAKATFKDDDAVMKSWIQCMDLTTSTLNQIRNES